ncbi:cache domain-containing sensor histidine kinase [Paenibacillus piri]|uniref:Sensor histidine kinase n=1 Tax=Paenibacillus piri TaxID=2547395 RepID=A0A4R5KJS1_9BACL|nr:sensor histidine kinase [Paenibacillus piri]TDF95392.1 sensor histidine kinase [Paenibacillus piri]
MRFRNFSIKTKIAMLSFIALFLALLFSGISIYAYMYGILSQIVVKDNTVIVANLGQQIHYFLDYSKQFAKNIIIDEKIQEALRIKDSHSMNEYDYYTNIRKIDEQLSMYFALRDNVIDDIYIIGSNNRIISNKYSGFSGNSDWYSEFARAEQASGFTAVHFSVGPSHPNSVSKVISYIITIHDKYNPERVLGKLVIDLKYEVLEEIFQQKMGSMNELHLIRPDQMIYTSAAGKDVHGLLTDLRELAPGTLLKDGRHFIVQRIAGADWTLVGSITEHTINAEIRNIGFRFMLILCICMPVLMLLMFPVVNKVTRPIMQLNRAMKEVSMGKLDKEIHIRSGDEIELLANGFNSMVRDIKRSMDESKLKEQKERQLELQLLMKQINPHFIYNTLNCVIYLARQTGADDIITLTRSFIMILQQTIKMQPDEMVTIREEITYIQNYVDILHYRYEEKVEFMLDVDPSLMLCKIPRMILYPLVENSIFHGILPGKGKGTLSLAIRRDQDMMHIEVADNGIGISPERMADIQKMLTRDISESIDHIGLHHVNQRLRIHFGEHCALQIESNSANRTRVSFTLPLELETM